MKKLLGILFLIGTALVALPVYATDNLISNGDFEKATTKKTGFGVDNVEFTDWIFGGIGVLAIETDDVYEGKQALKVNGATIATSLQQDVTLYETETVGQKYELIIHYKTITAAEGDVCLNSEWQFKNTDYAAHDADVLQQVLPLSNDWKELKVPTSFPEGARKLHVSVSVKQGNVVLFDDFRLVRVGDTPTAIENTEIDLNADDVEIYTIAGQRINQLQHGLNIVKQGNKINKIFLK